MQLSPNFSLAEMCQSQTALRRKIKNVPDQATTASMVKLCNKVLEPSRAHFNKDGTHPAIISSGFRCRKLNAIIGGAGSSQHCLGEAADYRIIGIKLVPLRDWIQKNLEFDQLILEFYDPRDDSGWVHVSYREGKNRKQAFSVG